MKKQIWKKWWFWVIVVFATLFLGMIASCGSTEENYEPTSSIVEESIVPTTTQPDKGVKPEPTTLKPTETETTKSTVSTQTTKSEVEQNTPEPTNPPQTTEAPNIEPPAPPKYIVYITPTGGKYHTARCRYHDADEDTAIEISEAQAAGYAPCGVCKP